MKLYFGLMTANIGLTLCCFGLMARVNLCQKNLEDAFFIGGCILLIPGVVVLFPLTVAELRRRIRARLKAWLSWKK